MREKDASCPPAVLLLHGLWMHAPAMRWLSARLSACGLDARTSGYFSVLESTDHAVTRIVAAIKASPGLHLVAHSLGGLIALRAASRVDPARLGRIVCMGTPLAGSRVAGGMAKRLPGGHRLLGPHLPLLLAGAGPIPRGVEAGMIAGSHRRGLGRLMARFDGDHDGTVMVDETRIDGLTDHIVLPASHSGLIFSDIVAEQVAAFLREGHFRR